MTYQAKASFDGKTWYQLEWNNIDFYVFDNIDGIKESNSIEELEKIVLTAYPNCNFKATLIGKRKK